MQKPRWGCCWARTIFSRQRRFMAANVNETSESRKVCYRTTQENPDENYESEWMREMWNSRMRNSAEKWEWMEWTDECENEQKWMVECTENERNDPPRQKWYPPRECSSNLQASVARVRHLMQNLRGRDPENPGRSAEPRWNDSALQAETNSSREKRRGRWEYPGRQNLEFTQKQWHPGSGRQEPTHLAEPRGEPRTQCRTQTSKTIYKNG